MGISEVVVGNSEQKRIRIQEEYFGAYWYADNLNGEPFSIKGKRMSKSIRRVEGFEEILTYVSGLVDVALDWERDETEFSLMEEEEAFKYGGDGLSMYTSVLIYSLLVENNAFPKNRIHYFQGFYEYEGKDPLLDAFFDDQTTVYRGPHAWLMINGAVIDLTLSSQRFTFDTKGEKTILGMLPKGMEYKGNEESEITVQKYISHFATSMGLTNEEWIEFHTTNLVKKFRELEGNL